MKIIKKYFLRNIWMFIIAATLISSCKKTEDAKLPTISFKKGNTYISSDASVSASDIVNVGIIADKNKADLRALKVYYSYGSNTLAVKNTFSLADNEKSHYEKDIKIKPGNSNGMETWKFEISDFDGNTNSVSLILTVN